MILDMTGCHNIKHHTQNRNEFVISEKLTYNDSKTIWFRKLADMNYDLYILKTKDITLSTLFHI